MADDRKLHIAMFPWLAFGHIIPYLQLAKLIASKGHTVSFISTARNIDRLPKIPPNISPFINFVKLSLPRVDNLPDNAEATIDLPFNKVKYLKIAYDNLQQPMTRFLETQLPDWVLFDFASYWLGPIAAKLNVRSAFFSIYMAAQLGYFGPPTVLMYGDQDHVKPEDFAVKPKWVHFESTVGIRLYEMKRIVGNMTQDVDNIADTYRVGATIEGCDAVAIRSCSDFEPEWLQLLGELYQKPVIEVGLLPVTAYESGNDDSSEDWRETKEWLDKQENGSVVYVAFGSETKLSQDEITELAFGLELSGLPFFWVVIEKRGSSDDELIELPEGFKERTRRRGIVCTRWAPQLKILSHDSVGGLLSHAGWSSVVEGIEFGRALILLPFLADQGLIASALVEKKMGYSIPRDEKDGSFTRDSVAESLRLVIVKEEGKIYRDKAKEMSLLFGNMDRQDSYVDNLLSFLQNHKIEKFMQV